MKRHKVTAVIAMVSVLLSCGKGFLDVKQNRNLRIPVSLDDYEALLRSIAYIASSHELGMIGADEYYVSDGRLATLSQFYQRSAYVWADQVYPDADVQDWNRAYNRILYANLIVNGLENLGHVDDNRLLYNIRGEALFHRAYNYYQLAQLFCKPYQKESAMDDPGIPLRLEPDVEVPIDRSTVAETYFRIQDDLEYALVLMKDDLPNNKLFASRQAVLALLAKVHLMKGEYAVAASYAENCLLLDPALMDFSNIDTLARHPFTNDNGLSNPEVIFYAQGPLPTILGNRFNADTTLLRSYQDGDIRKAVYFFEEADGRVSFKGTYTGSFGFFTGLAKNEVYLILAESLARLGEVQKAKDVMIRLLANRMIDTGFVELAVENQEELLAFIMLERRKELVLRGTRWEDLRRLNMEPRFKKTLTRTIDGETFRLEPNDLKYTWPIPDREIQLTGIEQNGR